VILGQVLEKFTGQPLDVALQAQVLDPLGLRNTTSWLTPEIPEPGLHAFSAERQRVLGILADTRFSEEATLWNPSWTPAAGAVQATTVTDMAATAAAIGEGTLRSPESQAAQIAPDLRGFGVPLAG
jgi:CubicO group peptidase (beta-lactamase class C family)